ncbi:hypothetical protein [Acidovorax sp.]|jgi:hypothetical protein|uniref:hypothetical protein n=1 Tax=Acidovorax sp. TaxID=1872122 RepID=UPI0025BAA4C1|nr:hypothetical protein [Acidovorax sp.]MCI5068859.1 hypothetical protein [Acidovorax sp.]
MALTLHIRCEGHHRYLARVFDGKRMVGTPTTHGRIEDAIVAYADQRGELPKSETFDLWLDGWCVGVVTTAQMQTHATELAERLKMLSAVLR